MRLNKLLAQGREAAEALMTDRCVVRRPTGQSITDPETGQVLPGFEDRHADLPCKISTRSAQGATPSGGEHQYTIEQLQLHLPINTDVWAGDEAEITGSEAGSENIGRIFLLTELNRGTYRTAQRWNVEVVTR